MIGRADIEGSKSNVAMNAWLPQASSHLPVNLLFFCRVTYCVLDRMDDPVILCHVYDITYGYTCQKIIHVIQSTSVYSCQQHVMFDILQHISSYGHMYHFHLLSKSHPHVNVSHCISHTVIYMSCVLSCTIRKRISHVNTSLLRDTLPVNACNETVHNI